MTIKKILKQIAVELGYIVVLLSLMALGWAVCMMGYIIGVL